MSDEEFRAVLGRFPSGIAVVTGCVDGVPVGLTCQSFTSLSLDPPLVLVCPARTSLSWPLIAGTGAFCANLLAGDQEAVSRTFATRGADKFAGLDWRSSEATGSPVLPGVAAWVDARIEAVHPGGDHDVVVGRVVDLAIGPGGDALTYYRGGYGSIR